MTQTHKQNFPTNLFMPVKSALATLAHSCVIKGWLLKGTVSNTAEKISILFYGHQGVRNDFARRFFNNDCEVKSLPLEPIYGFKERIRKKSKTCDLLMLQGRVFPDDILNLQADFYLPLFI